MNAYIAEFLGTFFLILLGESVNANVSLEKSGMKGSGTLHILIGWGTAVLLPAYSFGAVSGSHFNPTVTFGAAIRGELEWTMVPGYIIAQMCGGFCGAILVYLLFKKHFEATKDACVKRNVFCTSPSVRNVGLNILSEFVASFCLVFFLTSIPENAGESAISWALVYAVIVAMGASFGGLTGYAMNAARDTAPRIAYCFLPMGEGKDPDWKYGWIPMIVPIFGGICGSLLCMSVFG